MKKCIILLLFITTIVYSQSSMEISLNGEWEFGIDRNYSDKIIVPGLATDPTRIDTGLVCYRKQITLPKDDWKQAELILKGARFNPLVYVNGLKVSESQGGMTSTFHQLVHKDIKPGNTITLEICLLPLDKTDLRDASRIPSADFWRSNVSSCLWDDVILKLRGAAKIVRVTPASDIKNDKVTMHYTLEQNKTLTGPCQISFEWLQNNKTILTKKQTISPNSTLYRDSLSIDLNHTLTTWTPDNPQVYNLQVTLSDKNNKILEKYETNFGFREFKINGKGFELNGDPVKLRAGTVVWHRWVRDPEARELAFDIDWFKENIVQRLKDQGANTLRFHLGMPPEAFLDLCDRSGLMVQAEWSFFHGMEGSEESLLEQWRNWIDLCNRHPSVVLLHPWNETEGDRLQIAFSALDKLAKLYPPLVIAHRDVIHVHKYWWSLFENVGLYYDSADQFPQPIMVDEFGGNYLDGDFNPGGYPTVKESFLRFLGKGHTREMRTYHHNISNAKIAEYWRRLGAAGISPFCILGSPEDGSHWFQGPLYYGDPKPVWNALTASWSPVSVSIELWDRNFEPGDQREFPLYLFNDTDSEYPAEIQISLVDRTTRIPVFTRQIDQSILPFQTLKKSIRIDLPDIDGDWQIQAELINKPETVKYPVISTWNIRTITVKVPPTLDKLGFCVSGDNPELLQLLKNFNLKTADVANADILLIADVFKDQTKQSAPYKYINEFIQSGRDILILDAGPGFLGQGYPENDELGPLQGAPQVDDPTKHSYSLYGGVNLKFQEAPEPESHIHPAVGMELLWYNLDREATWLWNGLRGGLIVPAADMQVTGLAPEAFLEYWTNKGADPALVQSSSYYAYELEGYFEFSKHDKDKETINKLKKRVKLLFEDAPALQNAINPNAVVKTTDLADEYRNNKNASASNISALVCCGKNLSRTPVVKIDFDKYQSSVIVSQLLTRNRLIKSPSTGLYDIRYDPAAVQFVLNMLEQLNQSDK